jgi:7-cyano-7-deazaguanine synthase
LDSAILLGEAVRHYPVVHPIYVRVGSYWEPTEELFLRRFLKAIACSNLKELIVIDQPVGDIYGPHWSLTGNHVPERGTPDEASYLPGRNVMLFCKPLLWCCARGIGELATAPLASNPFPDATPQFYDGLANLVGLAVSSHVRIIRPYADMGLHKADVLKRGIGMPLEHTFSCIRPIRQQHCGQCSKCGERIDGFRDAGVPDPTFYAG